jgi:predicted amidohydrolase YtcJ
MASVIPVSVRSVPSAALVSLVTLVGSVAAAGCGGSPPDTIVTNGKIFTADAAQPWAQALAIRGDRIVAVGDTSAIAALAGPSTRRIDAGGRTIVPGINDAHAHVDPQPLVHAVQVPNEPTAEQIAIALAAADREAAPGVPLTVQIGARIWDDGAVTRAWVDERVRARAVTLQAYTGHGLILNSAALADAGINESIADPEGGRFVRDASGRLNGRVEENAGIIVTRRLAAKVDRKARPETYRRFASDALRFGITSVHLMATGLPHAEMVTAVVDAATPLRWRILRWPIREAGGETEDSRAHLPPQPSPRVDARGMKWMLDGTPIERLAAMRQPYADRPRETGRLNFQAERVAQFVGWAYGTEDPLAVHAVGDRAIETLLSALEQAGRVETWRAKRPRIEHGDMLMPDLIPRARALGVVVVQNPAHFTLRDELMARFGPERVRSAQPMKSLLDAGIPIALGSDGPLNPFLNILFATTHPVNPREALSREQAITAYTYGSAFAEFAERDKGRLVPGALADLAMLSADVFTVPPPQMPGIVSLLTLVGGAPAHDTGLWAGSR